MPIPSISRAFLVIGLLAAGRTFAASDTVPAPATLVADAYWLTPSLLAVPAQGKVSAQLLARDALTAAEPFRVVRDLGPCGTELPSAVAARFPHVASKNLCILQVPANLDVRGLLRKHVALAVRSASSLEVHGLQTAGVIDALFQDHGPLGVHVGQDVTISVWAPTARQVALRLCASSAAKACDHLPMRRSRTGVWTARGSRAWLGRFYDFRVQVFSPEAGKVLTSHVTDPYAFSLSANSRMSQIVNIHNDSSLMPSQWKALKKSPFRNPEDMVIYELHLRDFSRDDSSVPRSLQGKYKAFALKDSYGLRHLTRLARAGVTHVELMPVFDFNSVPETGAHSIPRSELAGLPPDSDEQQERVEENKSRDLFNWGYDPFHFFAPEGSYASNPEGAARIRELREAVAGLYGRGLRVIMDLVLNHTAAAGNAASSVLDRIVPGYYYRLNEKGQVENSSCCANLASENAMMERLMIDAVIHWVKAYRVDGFRFDLMGHHMLSNFAKMRTRLDELTLEKDGVDGKSIFLFGEGWDFAEVARNARGRNASQLNLGGTGLGSFNDRFRDALRGGGFLTSHRVKGFASGLADDSASDPESAARIAAETDHIRIGLAGNLADFSLSPQGPLGSEITYPFGVDSPVSAGYTKDPQENIAYVSCHDNWTLFDTMLLKARARPIDDLIRMNRLALAGVLFSQGVPFLEGGSEILRSKSLDGNSFDSGDWFNPLDYSYRDNGFGRGLPPGEENRGHWEDYAELLRNPSLKPNSTQIRATLAHLEALLRIRRSTPLLRLRTAAEIQSRLRFHDRGARPGVIAFSIDDHPANGPDLMPGVDRIWIFLNGTSRGLRMALARNLELHPDLVPFAAESRFERGYVHVAPRSAALFLERAHR